MSVETYVSRKDPCRCTTLPIPLPFPLAMKSAPKLERRPQFLRPQIHQLLSNNGFTTGARLIPYVVDNPLYPAPVTPQSMLFVILRGNKHAPHLFGPTRDELLALFQAHNIFDVHVEIRDIDLCFSASFFRSRQTTRS